MIPFLVQFKKDNPGITINTFSISREEAFIRLKNQEMDLAFYPADPNEDISIEFESIFISNYSEYWVLYKGHPLEKVDEKDIKQQEIAKFPFVVLEDCVYIKSFENFIKNYNIKSPIIFRYGRLDVVKEMVKTKTCVSIINGTFVTKADRKDLIFKSSLYTMPKMFYSAFLIKGFKLKEIAENFLKIIKENQRKIFH